MTMNTSISVSDNLLDLLFTVRPPWAGQAPVYGEPDYQSLPKALSPRQFTLDASSRFVPSNVF